MWRTVVVTMLIALVAAAPAAAAPGDGDPTFGTAGTVVGPAGGLTAVAADAQGRIVSAGTRGGGNLGPVVVTRRLPDGTLDPAFGTGGAVMFDRGDSAVGVASVALDAQGRILVGGGGQTGPFVARFTDAGQLDPGFGNGGIAEPGGIKGWYISGAAPVGDRVLVEYAMFAGFGAPRLARLTAAGAADRTFPVVELPFDAGFTPAGDASGQHTLLVRSDGSVLTVGTVYDTPAVYAVTADGRPVPGFGDQGLVRLPESPVGGRGAYQGVVAAPGGGAFVLAAGQLAKIHADGTLDRTFGERGVRRLKLTAARTYLTGLASQPDGGLLVSASEMPAVDDSAPTLAPTPLRLVHGPPDSFLTPNVVQSRPPTAPDDGGGQIARLTASGGVDCTYGRYGRVRLGPGGSSSSGASTLVLDPQGRAVIVGSTIAAGTQQLVERTLTGLGRPSPVTAARTTTGPASGGLDDVHRPARPTVQLAGWVDPRCRDVTASFVFGPTAAYGHRTAPQRVAGSGGVAQLDTTLTTLAPGRYHYRLETTGPGGPAHGADATFVVRRVPGILTVHTTHARLRGGAIGVSLWCGAGGCRAGVTLNLTVTSHDGTLVTNGTAGRSAVTLHDGERRRFRFALGRSARRLLRGHRVRVSVADLEPQTLNDRAHLTVALAVHR